MSAYENVKIQSLYGVCMRYGVSNKAAVSRAVRLRECPLSNISKTSASVSSGVLNTEKVMKARGRRPSAFIVSRCLEPLMKHEARVFDRASQMKQ